MCQHELKYRDRETLGTLSINQQILNNVKSCTVNGSAHFVNMEQRSFICVGEKHYLSNTYSLTHLLFLLEMGAYHRLLLFLFTAK